MIYDVAVVGLGPCGAVATALLGRSGVATFAFDKAHAVYDRPRAVAIDHEILRVFQQIGLMDRIQPWIAPATETEYYGVDGQLIRRDVDIDPPHPLGYPPSVVFAQPAVETVLRQRLGELDPITLSWAEELVDLEQHDGCVSLRLRNEQGAERTVQARYVIGCDGAASSVRQLLGIDLEDLEFNEPWLVADVLLNQSGLAKAPKLSTQYCEPSRPCWYIVGVGHHRRWQFAINPGEDPARLETAEATSQLLSRWIAPEDGELLRHAAYRFRGLVAAEWRRGRVFIAGDAAHQQPPYLGQGLCQGIRDVANLVWKLTSVLNGQLTGALLDTYGAERREHVRQFTSRLKAIGGSMFDRDLNRARARDARLLAESTGTVAATRRQSLQPRLARGLLSMNEHPANGTVFPQPWLLGDGARRRFDDVFGYGWRLVLKEDVDEIRVPKALRARLGLSQIWIGSDRKGIHEAEEVLADWFHRNACSAAVVRPDHYVYGVATGPLDGVAIFADLETHITEGPIG